MDSANADGYNREMEILLLTLTIFGIVVLAMSIGVIFRGQCLRGSCGGEEIWSPDGELLNCDTCPVRQKGDCDSQPAS